MSSEIQQIFFNQLIENQNEVSIYLKNGIKLSGKIISAAGDAIILNDPVPQMIYKGSVSTIITVETPAKTDR